MTTTPSTPSAAGFPPLPFSPFLFTDWTSETNAVRRTMYTDDQMQAYALAAIAAQQVAVPEGWQLVPKEPTQHMLDEVDEDVGGHCYSCSAWRASNDDCKRVYAAMLASAPLPPAVPQKNTDHLGSGVCGGVQMTTALRQDILHLIDELATDHSGDHFEPECPICQLVERIKSAAAPTGEGA